MAVGHDDLFDGFYDYLFKDEGRILGEATLAAKLNLYKSGSHSDLIHTYMIFGDPALRLPMPAQKVYLPGVQR